MFVCYRQLVCSMEGMSWNLLLVTRILAMNWTELEQWKLVLTGFAMSDRNNTLSRQIARTFLTKYIKQNQDLITKFDTPLSPNTVESMVFSIVQTERNILQLTWTSVTWQLQYVYLGTQRPRDVPATRSIDKVIPLSLSEAKWLATILVYIPSWCRWAKISVGITYGCRKWWATISV